MRNFAFYLAFGAVAFISGLAFDSESPVKAAQPASLAVTTTALRAGRVNVSYGTAVAVTGGQKPYIFSASALPKGLTINKTSGEITGAPTAGAYGNFEVSIKVTDSTKPKAQAATARLSLPIYNSVSAEACGKLNLGNNASFNGFVPFAPTDLWDTDISSAPIDPDNESITSAAGFAGLNLPPDFSSVADGNYGIPYVVVDSSVQPLVPINVGIYGGESDISLAPFPITAPIEGGPKDCAAGGWPHTYKGDAHVLVVDRNTCFLYETFNTHRCNGQWASDSEIHLGPEEVRAAPMGM